MLYHLIKILINKPNSREEAFVILKKLNNSKHYLISSVCIAKNGAMIWNHTDSSELKMKNLNDNELSSYLNKIDTKTLLRLWSLPNRSRWIRII